MKMCWRAGETADLYFVCERLVSQILTEQQDHIQVQKEYSEKFQRLQYDLNSMTSDMNNAESQL